ncbi:hypothetical protein NX059_012451 [Plenodomus lindquistii]|nr:hypothetical protein NX059_012451 [Plenodomus lindquistii]
MAKRKCSTDDSPSAQHRIATQLLKGDARKHTYVTDGTNHAYFEVRLREPNQWDTEEKHGTEDGIGLVCVEPPQGWRDCSQDQRDKTNLTASWMRPVTSLSSRVARQPALDIKNKLCIEYTRDDSHKFKLVGSDLQHEVKFLSLSALAGPRAPAKPRIVKRGMFESKPRVVRSYVDSDETIHYSHHGCGKCDKPLVADMFVFCVRCNNAICVSCTRVENRRPFRTHYNVDHGGLVLQDCDKAIVTCPTCRFLPQSVLVQATREPPGHPNWMAISFDMGTTSLKVLFSYSAEGKSGAQAIDSLPSTSVRLSGGKIFANDGAPVQGSTEFLEVKPIKLAICDEATKAKIEQRQVKVADIFDHFFERAFRQIELHQGTDLERWVQETNSSNESIDVYLAIAHPSGLGLNDIDLLMTALYHCGERFCEEVLKIKESKLQVVHMAESEAALRMVMSKVPLPPGSTCLVLDCGGTTLDATIVETSPEDRLHMKKYLRSTSLLYGAENNVDELSRLTQKLTGEGVLSRDHARNLILPSTLSRDPTWPAGTKDIWDRLYASRLGSLEKWLKSVCDDAIAHAKKSSSKLQVLITGGGFFDSEVKRRVKDRFDSNVIIHEQISTQNRESTVVHGLHEYTCSWVQTSSPHDSSMTILQESDEDLEPASEAIYHIVQVRKGDCLDGKTILPLAQAMLGETITIKPHWVKDTEAKVRLVTCDAELGSTEVKHDFLSVTGLEKSALRTVATTSVAEPANGELVKVACTPFPHGRSVVVHSLLIDKQKEFEIDFMSTSAHALRRGHSNNTTKVHTLDVCDLQGSLVITRCDELLEAPEDTPCTKGSSNMDWSPESDE